jgi:hypothetical protein
MSADASGSSSPNNEMQKDQAGLHEPAIVEANLPAVQVGPDQEKAVKPMSIFASAWSYVPSKEAILEIVTSPEAIGAAVGAFVTFAPICFWILKPSTEPKAPEPKQAAQAEPPAAIKKS